MDYYAATVSALALAITAKDDEKAGEATRLAEAFAAHIPDRLEEAKEEAENGFDYYDFDWEEVDYETVEIKEEEIPEQQLTLSGVLV